MHVIIVILDNRLFSGPDDIDQFEAPILVTHKIQ